MALLCPHSRTPPRSMRFTDGHAMSVCTPSRAALMTGRLGLRTGVVVNFWMDSEYGLPLNESTLPELLKPLGYDTMMAGKWHLGINHGHHPTQRGFDSCVCSSGLRAAVDRFSVPTSPIASHLPTHRSYVGLPYSVDMGCVDPASNATNLPMEAICPTDSTPSPGSVAPALPLYNTTSADCAGLSCNASIVEQPVDLQHLSTRYVDAATDFINMHALDKYAKPFLLYIAFSHMHVPLAHDPRWTGQSTRHTIFADTLLELDWSVGQIMAALDAAGVTNDTIIFFTGACRVGGGSERAGVCGAWAHAAVRRRQRAVGRQVRPGWLPGPIHWRLPGYHRLGLHAEIDDVGGRSPRGDGHRVAQVCASRQRLHSADQHPRYRAHLCDAGGRPPAN